MLTYQRGGHTLAYSVVGEGSPVLFIHGATGTGEYEWGRLAGRLAARHRCVLPDLCGHGRSDHRPSGYSGQEVAADLRRLIDHVGLDRPHVVGFSYGAEIALMLELDAPGTARSLVLISPGTGRASGYRMPSVEYLHRIWPAKLRGLHAERHGPDHWRSLVTVLQQDAQRRPELPAETLANVRCPALLLVGDRDDPIRRRQARQFADVNPAARYEEIAGATHAAHLERPDDVARLVGEFLTEMDVSTA
jgi:pimeloyl-ACP methyl ester carboxylesterase